MNEAIYRLAQPEDRASLLEFWIDAYTDSFPYIRRRHPREGFSDFYDTWVDKGNQFHVGMRESIVSMCAYKDGHIQHLYVSKSCQGQGVGSGMIRYIINLYRAPLYYLYVFRKNTEAIRLYQKLGFVIAEALVSKFEQEPTVRMEYAPTQDSKCQASRSIDNDMNSERSCRALPWEGRSA